MEGLAMRHRLRRWIITAAFAGLPLISSVPFPAWAATSSPSQSTATTYPSPDAAAAALIDALQRDDVTALRAILGPGSEALITSGDSIADHEARANFVTAYQKKHRLSATAPDQMTLVVGENDFPLPLPIIRTGGTWHFDSALGAQELVDRRIGRNEIAAIRVALAYYDAQKLYFEMSNAAGRGEYAQHMVCLLYTSPSPRD